MNETYEELANEQGVLLRDAVMLLRRCLISGKSKPISPEVRKQVLYWISRKGLTGSPLRKVDTK